MKLMYICIVFKSRQIYGNKEKIQTGSRIKTDGSGPLGSSLSPLFMSKTPKDFWFIMGLVRNLPKVSNLRKVYFYTYNQ